MCLCTYWPLIPAHCTTNSLSVGRCVLVFFIFLLRFSRHGICCGCLFTTAANHDPTQKIR
jgi:hypothetical protein